VKIHCESIHHYIHWMKTNWFFSFAGFSDAEWYCILKHRIGDKTGLGQVLSAEHGELLFDILKRRQHAKNFLFAVPKCLWQLPGFAEGQIDWFLGNNNIKIEGYERDMVLDDLARDADLYPFIRYLKDRKVVMVGPEPLRPFAKGTLKCQRFIEISTPNLHLEEGGIDRTVENILKHPVKGHYLISAGVSAAVIIDRIHDKIPYSWFIDCGSIWDAFVGIGGQRQWRAELYADKEKYNQWLKDNLEGKQRR